MSKLSKMRDRLNGLQDTELLEVAKDLLTEMAEIQKLKEQIELREEGLIEGKRAAFYFFAQGLDPEELSHAANTANGRLRFLKEKEERELTKARIDGDITEEEEQEKKEQLKTPQDGFSNSFGGLGSSFGGDK
jgi:hypothetical protein